MPALVRPGEPHRTSGDRAEPGPARAVQLAARRVDAAQRLDMQALARELGVSRVTLHRWTGGREALLGEALWLLTDRSLTAALRRWERERPPRALLSVGAGRLMNRYVSQSPGLRRLLDEEPALAIRVLTEPRGPVQGRVVAFVARVLRRDADEQGFVPLIEPDALAYALVRLGESFLYADVLAARPPDVDAADRLQRALIEGTRP